MSSLRIISPGVLSLLQDAGRFGQGQLGLTQGGPLDQHSFRWANTLVGNPINTTLIEHSVGGLIVQAQGACTVAVTGATLPLSHNGHAVPCWQAIHLAPGDELALGNVSQGLRVYLAVQGGIQVAPQFGSTATVMREGIGGLLHPAADNPQHRLGGHKLYANDCLPLASTNLTRVSQAGAAKNTMPQNTVPQSTPVAPLPPAVTQQTLPSAAILRLRIIEGYQATLFSAIERARFYLNPYRVSPKCDRMGYKLTGSAIRCSTQQLLSEGISAGAVQIPPDGQPIVLLNDRQTLGGYPKMGNVLSLDCWALAQATPGTEVQFAPISVEDAHNALQLDAARFTREAQRLGLTSALTQPQGRHHD